MKALKTRKVSLSQSLKAKFATKFKSSLVACEGGTEGVLG